MPEQPVTIAVFHVHKPWTVRREMDSTPEQLTETALPAALNLHADVPHDGGANFGVLSPLIRLEARGDQLPTGWSWPTNDLPTLPHARPWQQPGWFAGA